jgi:hypothetical protein
MLPFDDYMKTRANSTSNRCSSILFFHTTTWAGQGQPSSDASEEVPMVTQLDEERKRLWELAKANLEKAHKRYKDFTDKS